MKFTRPAWDALIALRVKPSVLQHIEGIDGDPTSPGYEPLVKMLNDFVANGGRFRPGNSSYYTTQEKTIYIKGAYLNGSLSDYELVRSLAHEVFHAVSEMDPYPVSYQSAERYSSAYIRDEAEAYYFATEVLHHLYADEFTDFDAQYWPDHQIESTTIAFQQQLSAIVSS